MPARRKKTAEQPCSEHFPDGWDGIDEQHESVKVTGVGCEHGTWTRDGKVSDPKTSDDGSGSGSGEGDGAGDGQGSGDGSGDSESQGSGDGEGSGE